MKKYSLHIITLFILFVAFNKQNFLFAQQQIINLSIAEAETIFMQNNLLIIAEKYNVNIAEANLIQAKLFENPELTFEQNIYSDNGQYFDFGKQNVIQLDQLFELGGKRRKRTKLEKINLEIAQFQFQDVLRILRNDMRENFIELHYLKKITAIYDKGIDYLKKLIEVYDRQHEKGNVSLIEKVRLKALLLDLQAEKIEVGKERIDVQKELNILLNQSEQTLVNTTLTIDAIHNFSFDDDTYNHLVKELKNAPQMQIAKKEIQSAQANLKLQKSLKIPNLTVGAIYEREGNVKPENVGLAFNLSLPIFNRNQGDIAVAEAEFSQTQILYNQQEKEMINDLFATYQKANETLKFFQELDKNLEGDFENLIEGIILNFERKTINMIEFIDYYETYKETIVQIKNIEKDTILSIEAINFLLGKSYFNVLN